MEAFKSEQKRLAATASHRDKEKISKEKEAEERRQREKAEIDDRERQQVKQEDEKREKELDELERLVLQQARRQGSAVPEITSFPTIEVVTVTASSYSTNPTSSGPANATAETLVADLNKTSSSTSSSTRIAPPRSDSSESIYAHIIRRLNALEGNSSLVARYIEEQAKVMRHMLSRVEKGWDDWQVERELDELSRWEQEVCSTVFSM